MNKDSLFVYEEDGFCELKYTFKDLRRLKRENQKLKEQYCERTDCTGRLGNNKKVEELIKENERLKEELEQLQENYKAVLKQRDDTNKSAMETIEKYQQENERLKQLEDDLTTVYLKGYEDGKNLYNHYKLLYQKVKERTDELEADMKFVLEQILGAFTQNWCIDWNFTEIREKHSISDKYEWNKGCNEVSNEDN